MARLKLAVGLLLMTLVGCGFNAITSGVPASSAATTAIGSLCDDEALDGLANLIGQFEDVDSNSDIGALIESAQVARSTLEQLVADSDELAEWRDASIDAMNQFERQAQEPDRVPIVAEHAARTLGGLEVRLCK